MSTNDAPKKSGRVATKYFLIPLIGSVAIAVLILVLSLSLQLVIQPVGFKTVNISGGPGIGDYDIFFALVDIDQNNGPSNGYVYFKITDGNQTVLYRSDYLVRSFHFTTYSNYTGGVPTVGYRWTVPLANVTPGMPLPGGLGTAEVLFLAFSGWQIPSITYIPIPAVNP